MLHVHSTALHNSLNLVVFWEISINFAVMFGTVRSTIPYDMYLLYTYKLFSLPQICSKNFLLHCTRGIWKVSLFKILGFHGSEYTSRGLLGSGGSKSHLNIGILPQHYTMSEHRWPWLEEVPVWQHHCTVVTVMELHTVVPIVSSVLGEDRWTYIMPYWFCWLVCLYCVLITCSKFHCVDLSWDVDSCSVDQENPHLYGNRRFITIFTKAYNSPQTKPFESSWRSYTMFLWDKF